jgi:glutamyl-tRNA synthetase
MWRGPPKVRVLENVVTLFDHNSCFLLHPLRRYSESEASVIADLKWLGLHWDEGPDMVGTKYGPYRQSERGDIYLAAAHRLLQERKAYRCFCTPEELEEMKAEQEARGETPRYDGRWRDADDSLIQRMLAEGRPYTIRFKVPDNARVVIDDVVRGTVAWDAQATVGDFILLRSSGVPVYNFCVAVDDAAMGVTTVVRAEEHLTNTVRQALVLDGLGAPRPRYAHCSLILGEDKQKLSKRHGATSCDQYRKDGYLPDAMINYLALLGWNDGTDNEIFARDELIEAFDLNRVVKSPSVFDVEKLNWVNAQHMKLMSVEDLMPLVLDQMQWEGVLRDGLDVKGNDWPAVGDFVFAATALAKQMMETTKDAAINAKQVLQYGLPATFDQVTDPEAQRMIEQGHFYPLARALIERFQAGTFPLPDPANPVKAFKEATGPAMDGDTEKCRYTQDYMSYMKSLAKQFGVKGKELFHPVRLALTGEMSGQDVTKQLSLLAMASGANSVIDQERVGVVELGERVSRLAVFCDSIPEEYRTPQREQKMSAERGAAKPAPASERSGQDAPTSSGSATSDVAVSGASDPKDTYSGPPISALDIRVGKIVRVWEHPEAEKLYCEEIDVGEDQPRQIASGLRPYLAKEDMEGRKVLVLCNLKARKLVGFESHGMVLCASNQDHSVVKLVSPPVDSMIGERVSVPDFKFDGTTEEDGMPFAENKIGKKKIFEQLAPFLVTSKYGIPEFLGRPFMTSAGVCTSSIPDGTVG